MAEAAQPEEFELVLAVYGHWDQPRDGIALVGGVPHRFHCPFEEQQDEYSETYRLREIEYAVLRLECEAFEIDTGHPSCPELPQVLPDPIPRFPEAKPRYNAILQQLVHDRQLVEKSPRRATAKFRHREAPESWRGRQLWSVKWTLVSK